MPAGSANYFLELLRLGGIGGVLSLADVIPEECVDLYRAFRDGRIEEAEGLNAKLVELNGEVSGRYGMAGVKAAMDGPTGGAPRRPLRPLSDDERRSLERALRERGSI